MRGAQLLVPLVELDVEREHPAVGLLEFVLEAAVLGGERVGGGQHGAQLLRGQGLVAGRLLGGVHRRARREAPDHLVLGHRVGGHRQIRRRRARIARRPQHHREQPSAPGSYAHSRPVCRPGATAPPRPASAGGQHKAPPDLRVQGVLPGQRPNGPASPAVVAQVRFLVVMEALRVAWPRAPWRRRGRGDGHGRVRRAAGTAEDGARKGAGPAPSGRRYRRCAAPPWRPGTAGSRGRAGWACPADDPGLSGQPVLDPARGQGEGADVADAGSTPPGRGAAAAAPRRRPRVCRRARFMPGEHPRAADGRAPVWKVRSAAWAASPATRP